MFVREWISPYGIRCTTISQPVRKNSGQSNVSRACYMCILWQVGIWCWNWLQLVDYWSHWMCLLIVEAVTSQCLTLVWLDRSAKATLSLQWWLLNKVKIWNKQIRSWRITVLFCRFCWVLDGTVVQRGASNDYAPLTVLQNSVWAWKDKLLNYFPVFECGGYVAWFWAFIKHFATSFVQRLDE